MHRLDANGERFVFFANGTTGRGNVVYRRYDGHYGLITPAKALQEVMLVATHDRSRTEPEDTTIESGAASTAPPSPMFEPPGPPLEPDDPISTLMSTPVAWVEPTVSLVEVAATLATEGVGAAAVFSGDHLDGVVSERDVVRALSRGGTASDVWAVDVMTAEPVYVDPDEPILTVAERMLDEGVRHLPVVRDGQVVGVVSVRDALRVLADAWRRARTTEEA